MEIRTLFHKQLHAIQDEVLVICSMVEDALTQSIQSLRKRDLELAQKTIENDLKIDKKRYEIEEKCVQLLATQQPMASDLRVILSMFSMASELERMGDHAEGIAKIAVMIGDEPPLKPLIDIPSMAEKTGSMLKRSIEAFINRDAEAARKIIQEDDEIDKLYNQVFRELVSFMVEDPRTITRATRLIWVAHNLERSADRVTNICERIIFIVTGKMQAGEQKLGEDIPR